MNTIILTVIILVWLIGIPLMFIFMAWLNVISKEFYVSPSDVCTILMTVIFWPLSLLIVAGTHISPSITWLFKRLVKYFECKRRNNHG